MADSVERSIHELRGYVRVVRSADAYPLHRTLGGDAVRREQFAVALDHFLAMIEGNPRSVEAWTFAGNACLALGRPEKALEHFERAQAIELTSGSARLGRGLAELGLGREARAAALLRPLLDRIRDRATLARLNANYRSRGDSIACAAIASALASPDSATPRRH